MEFIDSRVRITENYWVSFWKATSKNLLSAAVSGFPKTLGKSCVRVAVITRFPVGNPCQKNGFLTVFLVVPEFRKASNFAPWSQDYYSGKSS